MSFKDDLQSFLETRLLSFDPSIDLSPNSPAQLQIIAPIIERFGEDPFSSDIPTFIRDRLLQEFPDMAADNGGMLEDILTKPIQLLLEPFKRQIQLVQVGGSFQNAAIMAESEADALGANWFTERDTGDFASGPVRLFYAQPTTARCGTDKKFSTSAGLAYFPIQNYSITAQQMLFNRQGSFYFFDIVIRAELPGNQYNVSKGAINNVEGMSGVIKVANLSDFITGNPKETNQDYISRIENSLTDRSFVTKRGILSRVPQQFENIRALQIVGAGDSGMNRDILTGTGQGFLHLAGKATVFGDWLWISEVTYRDDGPSDSVTPQPGDTIRFHPTSPAPSATTVVEATIITILSSNSSSFLLLLDKSLYSSGVTHQGAFVLLKPGTISISNIPGGISSTIEVPDNTVHLGGHTDIFIRPTEDSTIQTTIQNITDDQPLVAILDLSVPTAGQNLVRVVAEDFISLGVESGDLLVIDTGTGFAGTYQILEVINSTDLRVSSIFPLTTTSNLRARIIRNIRLDLVSPKIPKLPFTNSPVSDLQTNVGSNEFHFATINIQDFTAKIGDTINILEGADAGEFTIINFGIVAGSVFVDRSATATGANLSYQIYTKQSGLDRPLIRLKEIEVLDSTGQATGITIPYGDAVDIRPTCDFEGAGNEKITYDKQLIIFPDMLEWSSGGLPTDAISLGVIDDTTDARYTLGLAISDGIVRTVNNDSSNQIHKTEINVPPFLWNGKRDKLLALVSRIDPNFPLGINGIHKSSDLADAKIGDSITIKDGPNQGKYIILDVRVLELWGKSDQGHRKVAILQIDPPLKVDPIRTALNLINIVHGSTFFNAATLFGFLQYAADWDNNSGFYAQFITELRTDLTSVGVTFASDADLKIFFDPLIRSSYSVGPSAKGIFRTFFLEPVSAEFNFGEAPTIFNLATDGSKQFRLDPNLQPAQILPESVIPTSPALWNRNLGVRFVQDHFAFLTSGSSFVTRGIQAGDILEFYPAINDLPARGSMTTSWLCVTQAGSNIIRLILPQSNGTQEAGYGGVDNFTNFIPGQFLFIDSGPDIGAFVITKVISQNWISNPPNIQVQLDQPLTHSTNSFPVLSTSTIPPDQLDFSSNLPAYLTGSTLTFPLNLNGKHIKIDTSSDAGTTWSSVEHIFVASDPYNNLASIVIDIAADLTFTAAVTTTSTATALILTTAVAGPRMRIRVNVSPTSPSAHTLLGLISVTIVKGIRGAATLPNTKRIYGSGLNQVLANDWITIYAANETTILTNGDDSAVIGTYLVTAVGSDASVAPFWTGFSNFVELDRTANFPTGNPISIRWIRHEQPDTIPSNTSNGGKNISDQFVRFRTYDSVSKKLTILDIPWATAAIHPLLDTSDQQIELVSPGIISGSERNYTHKSPYRILRDNILRISSTEMSAQRDGALYFIDLPVIGYGPGSEMNVTLSDGFVLAGNRKVDGYTLSVADENFSFSDKEDFHLILPNSILPVGSATEIANQFNLAGQNLQITYDNAPLIEDLQTLFNAPLDRVTAANMLARHFLPGYVFLDATYNGGASEDIVAIEIIKYINNIGPDVAEIRSDLIQDIIKRKGAGTADLPITIITLFHGVDRKIRGMRSTKSIGITDIPFFKGNFLQSYFIAGPDTSNIKIRPSGEQIFLKRT